MNTPVSLESYFKFDGQLLSGSTCRVVRESVLSMSEDTDSISREIP
jgi:hypothetical protein